MNAQNANFDMYMEYLTQEEEVDFPEESPEPESFISRLISFTKSLIVRWR